MKAKQLFFVLAATCCLLIVGLFAVAYETNNILGTQAHKLAKLRADNDAANATETTLAKNKRDIAKYSDLNKIAESIVPQDKDQAEAIREIVNLANASGIPKLTSITFPTSTLGTATTGPQANPNLTQLTPVVGMSGVYQLPITVVQDAGNRVPFANLIRFLQGLEQNRRTAQVSSITVQPDDAGTGKVAFTLVINEYIKP